MVMEKPTSRQALISRNTHYKEKLNGQAANDPSPYPHTKNGRILDTKENLKYLLEQNLIEVKYNLMTRRREIFIPGIKKLADEKDNAAFEHIDNLANINYVPTRRLNNRLHDIGWDSPYHPIREGILAKPWDEKHRVCDFIKTIKSPKPELAELILRRWMTAAIAAAFSDTGFASQGVLVLQGEQRIGKTSFAKSLDFLDCNAVREGASLDPRCKDDVINAGRFWIVELGELDATLKNDMARLKSYLTNQVDWIRYPYGKEDTYVYRRTVFMATVNENEFLVDTTGNRRWWTIPVTAIELNHGIDMQQVWAEVYDGFKDGALSSTTREEQEIINESNKEYEKVDPIEDRLRAIYDWGDTLLREQLSHEILEDLGYKNYGVKETRALSVAYKRITGQDGIKGMKGKKYTMPRYNPKSL